MKKLALLLLVPFFLMAWEYKGNISLESQYLHLDIENKRDNSLAIRVDGEVKQDIGLGQFVARVKGIYDKDDEERRYLDFYDLYHLMEFENGDLIIGRSTRFWGALEFYNLTDVFNTKDFLDDPFDYDSKLGTWNVGYTHFFEASELSLIVRFGEEKQKMQDKESVNNFLPFEYDDRLHTQEGKNRPSIFLKYSGSGDEIQVDYSLIFQNGYDAQRYMSFDFEDKKLRQNAYIVNKLMGYATYLNGDTIYKGELSYVISDSDKVSDYSEFGIGLEHTLYGFWDKKDLGLLAEYYRYDEKDDDKYDFEKFFADDLTLGFRLSINDHSSSEVLGGIDIDMQTDEQIYFVEYDTRIFDKYKLKTSYQHLEPEDESVFERLDRVKLELGYYF